MSLKRIGGFDRADSPQSVMQLANILAMTNGGVPYSKNVGKISAEVNSQNERLSPAKTEVTPNGSSTTTTGQSGHYGFAGGLFWLERSSAGNDASVGPFLRKGSLVAFGLWILGLFLVYTASPADSFEYLEGSERSSNIAVLTVLLCTNVSRFLHLVIRDQSFIFVNTGVMFGAVAVQIMAIASISLMLAFPTPVLIDPVTGLRSHMVRWVEWTVLAFLMTFLTESIDMPLKDSGGPKIAWIHGVAIGLSTMAGGIFPFCKTWGAWLSVFTMSWILFCSLFYRLYIRYHRFIKMPTEGSFEIKDEYERAKYSLKTIAVCTVIWTLLAASFSVIAIARPFVAEDSFFAGESLVLVTESVFEVISKVWYFNLLIEVHGEVFDDASRAMRRLEGLRVLMSTIWNSSSDVMVFCSKDGDGRIHAVVSPSFFDLSDPPSEVEKLCRLAPQYKKPTLVLEVDEQKKSHFYRIIELNLSSAVTRQDAVDLLLTESKDKNLTVDKGSEMNIEALSSLLVEVFRSDKNEMVLTKEMHGLAELRSSTKTISCEAKISKLDSSCLVVMRDVSERFQRFQTEKKLVEEITARKKDAEANRFTRHEVKNSILAAIGVLESMRGSSKAHGRVEDSLGTSSIHSHADSLKDETLFEDHAGELDNTLRTVLDTIMDHAMSREVIYEEYEVRKERVMVPDVLTNIGRHTNSSAGTRFTLTAFPEEFPVLGMDPRLLRYIYQNALSNACRYGKKGGSVETSILYDYQAKEFRMEVVNLPGVGHNELLELTHDEIQEKVFAPGCRLHNKRREEHEMNESNSSGDGAWIMKKCAIMQKGDCELRFEPDRTIFAFWCPARAHRSKDFKEPELTAIPSNTWGVVIDDSGIQRKLMDRYLKVAGVDKNRRVVVGKDANEIYGFCDMVVELVERNPLDKFLVIADENLDVLEGGVALHGTVSGSLCLQKILERLDPVDSDRVLALVRSANDSAKETDVYKSRAHGYLVKAPIDKAGILKSLEPWWFKRFPPHDEGGSKTLSFGSSGSLDIDYYDPFVDIRAALEVVDALISAPHTSMTSRWRSIQDRLQALKGDLKSTIPRGGPQLNRVIHAIDELRLGPCPDELRPMWISLRKRIDEVLNDFEDDY